MIAKAMSETAIDTPDDRAKALQKPTVTETMDGRCKRYDARRKDKPVKFELTENGSLAFKDCEKGSNAFIEAHVKLADILCTIDGELKDHLLNQVAKTFYGAAGGPKKMVAAMNLALAMIHEIQPRDHIEAMLAIQMVGVHNAAMEMMSLASLPKQTAEVRKESLNFAVRMLRMFRVQMETLQKYRTGGQQKVTVEHVHVNAGGQAIVGSVNTGGTSQNAR